MHPITTVADDDDDVDDVDDVDGTAEVGPRRNTAIMARSSARGLSGP